MAMGVLFAILASYVLSRTLVPTMARYLLAAEVRRLASEGEGKAAGAAHRGPIERVSGHFIAAFERFRGAYRALLAWALGHRRVGAVPAARALPPALAPTPFLGPDAFPPPPPRARPPPLSRPPGAPAAPTRATPPNEFPGLPFCAVPADIVNQVLNLGLPAPIDVQVVGPNKLVNYQTATRLADAVRRVPGAVDVRVQQVANYPDLLFSVDRTLAQQLGLTQRQVASNLLISLSSSAQAAPNFWLNPQSGISYTVQVQTPPDKITSLEGMTSTPVTAPGLAAPQLLGNLAPAGRQTSRGVVHHYNLLPVSDVDAAR